MQTKATIKCTTVLFLNNIINIDRNCLTLFISTVDSNKLSKLPNIRVYQKKLKKVTFSTIQEIETYIVYAHSSVKAPMYSSEYSQHGHGRQDFCRQAIQIHNNFISFFVKTNQAGSLSVSLAWIDVPINLKSLYPLFSYFEFYIIGPDGKVYSEEEQFSTKKKIVIKKAPIGNYEIRLRMNQIVPSEYSVDYSLVIVGPFDHLNFMNNPIELKPITTKTCSSKCPVNKGFAHCNSETAICVCDKLHTGINCEYEVFEISENKAVKHSLGNREFLYTHLDFVKIQKYEKNRN